MSYTFDEFIRHWVDYGVVRDYAHIECHGEQVEIGVARSYDLTVLRVFDYMRQLYGDTNEAREKGMLFTLMSSYLDEHGAAFDVGTLAVTGSKTGLVSQYLLRAIHHIFTSRPLSELGHGPSTTQVIELATQYERDDHAA